MNASVLEEMGEGEFSSDKGIGILFLFFSFTSQDLHLNISFLKASEAVIGYSLNGGGVWERMC